MKYLLILLLAIVLFSAKVKVANVWLKNKPQYNKIDSTFITKKDTCYALINNINGTRL